MPNFNGESFQHKGFIFFSYEDLLDFFIIIIFDVILSASLNIFLFYSYDSYILLDLYAINY
jgi:hypothetical protein